MGLKRPERCVDKPIPSTTGFKTEFTVISHLPRCTFMAFYEIMCVFMLMTVAVESKAQV